MSARLRLARFRTSEHHGQHRRCPECRALVERHRKYARPGLTGRAREVTLELADGQIIVKYDPATGEILDLCDWNGNEVHGHWDETAEDAVAEAMAKARGES